MDRDMLATIKGYVWVPSGEMVRGIEVAVGTAFMRALYAQDITDLAHAKVWLTGALVAGLLAGWNYVKGKLPAPVPPLPPTPPKLPEPDSLGSE